MLALVGWWSGALICEAAEAERAWRWWREGPRLAGGPWASDLPLAYPRALRRAAGIGPRRSVDMARYLWREGPEAELESLAGVGPRTALAARGVLEELSLRGVVED